MPAHSHRRPGVLTGALLAVALGVLLVGAVRVVAASIAAIGFPLSLDYGEGIVLQQALLLIGPSAYGDVTRYPFIVFHYPPGYLLAVRAVAALGYDIVEAGRGVSVAATLFAAAAIGALAHAGTGAAPRLLRLGAAAAGAMALFAFTPVSDWMVLARVDMLALAFGMAGLALVPRIPGAPWRAYAAALLFTCAVYTRQTALAAPLAATLVLLVASPRDAVRLVVAGIAMALALLGIGMVLTDGGLLQHLLAYNINRFGRIFGFQMMNFITENALPALVALAAFALGLWRVAARRPRWTRAEAAATLARDPAARTVAVTFLYFAIATPMLALAGKSGSNVNYFLEWVCGAAMLTGLLFGWIGQGAAAAGVPAARLVPVGAALLAGVLALQLAIVRNPARDILASPTLTPEFMSDLVAAVRQAPHPVISDDMVLLLRGGKEVPWEPAIFAELAALGRWDERLITNMIRAGSFSFAVTRGGAGDTVFDRRYNPAVAEALDAAFPNQVRRGAYVIRLPAGASFPPAR